MFVLTQMSDCARVVAPNSIVFRGEGIILRRDIDALTLVVVVTLELAIIFKSYTACFEKNRIHFFGQAHLEPVIAQNSEKY